MATDGETEKIAPLALVPTVTVLVLSVYHLIELPGEVAFSEAELPMHMAEGLAVTDVGAAGML